MMNQNNFSIKEETAQNINILGNFLGIRDIDSLDRHCLQQQYDLLQADVMVLFGGSILCGGDVLATAIKNKLAKKYVIVGGAGHTTETLRQKVQQAFPSIQTNGLTEAEIFNHYLDQVYGSKADYLETQSTNCGNNITNLLSLLKQEKIDFKTIILCQDATMQRRMDAGIRKYLSEDKTIINYASYQANVIVQNEQLLYSEPIRGMWDMDRYVNLLMGEIPRLTDDSNGYGPNGTGYIAHVEIPKDVRTAFEALKKIYGEHTREANPLYASRV